MTCRWLIRKMTAIRNIQSRIYIRRNWIKYSSSPLPHIRMPKVWWFLTMIITLTRQDLFDAFPDEAGQIHNDSLLQKGRETICLVGAQKYKFKKKKIILVRRRKRLHHVLPLLTLHTKDPTVLIFPYHVYPSWPFYTQNFYFKCF